MLLIWGNSMLKTTFKYLGHGLMGMGCLLFGFGVTFSIKTKYLSLKEQQNLNRIQNANKAVFNFVGYNDSQLFPVGTVFQIKYHNKLYLVTAGHVCISLNHIEDSGRTTTIQVEDVKYSVNESYTFPDDDICLVKSFGFKAQSYLELDSLSPADGETLYTIGYPAIDNQPALKFFNAGVKAGTYKVGEAETMRGYPLIGKELPMFQRRTYPGQSGSPVLNSKGKVIGIIVMRNDQNIGIFTKVDKLIKYLDENP